MRVSAVGEKGLVKIAREIFSGDLDNENVIISLGDDAAAVREREMDILVSTDICYASTHFPEGSDPYLCGWYAAAVNFSDLAAMGALPFAVLLGIGLPPEYPLDWFKRVLRGLKDCCHRYGAAVIGGDTKSTPSLMLAPVVLGKCQGNRILSRNGCEVGDPVYIVGTLGGSYSALAEIEDFLNSSEKPSKDRGEHRYVGPDETEYEYYRRMLKIEPRIDAGRILSASQGVSCCMDVSDGLALTLHELSALNDVGFSVEGAALPVDEHLVSSGRYEEKVRDIALYRGGDFGLLFTVSSEHAEEVEERMRRGSVKHVLTRIGIVTEDGVTLRVGEREMPLSERGWEHLRG